MKKAPGAAKSSVSVRGDGPARNRGPAAGRSRPSKAEQPGEVFPEVGRLLREGRSSQAEEILRQALENPSLSPDDLANLKRLLAFTLETVGRYKEALEILKPFENEEELARLTVETQIRVITQLAISYNNVSDHPKAVTLLKETLEKAEANELQRLSGSIDCGMARVYRKLNDCPISRD